MSRRDDFAEVARRDPVDEVTGLTLIAAEAAAAPPALALPGRSARPAEADVVHVLATLDALAGLARPHLRAGQHAAEGLRVALGEQAGFGGGDGEHADLRSSLLPDVLARRRGLPVLLSTVWVEVARRVDVPARSLAAPGRVLTEIDGVVVDPAAGGRVADPREAAVARAAGRLGGAQLLLRVLANLRALAARTGDTTTGLWACELSLLLPSHPLSLRREHAALLVRAGRFGEGSAELEDFADVAPEPAAEQARREARMARARLS